MLDYRIASWGSFGYTTILLFPLFLTSNLVFRLSPRKMLWKSIADALLFYTYGVIFEEGIRRGRRLLTVGSEKQKKLFFQIS